MNANSQFDTIAQLDLDPIKVKLMHKESGEGWSLAHANMIEGEYRRFLCLMKLFPDEPLAPLFDVDIFWHYHILDTMKYATDCENIFGYFLHHFPYLGLRGDDDEEAHHRVGARTKELYAATFGSDGPADDRIGAAATTAWSMTAAAADGARGPDAHANTAWSMTVTATGAALSLVPASARMRTAWSMTVQNGKVDSIRPATGKSGNASMHQAQNGAADSSPAALRAPATAWSMTPSRHDWSDGELLSGEQEATAWSMTYSQHRPASLQRPILAIAA